MSDLPPEIAMDDRPDNEVIEKDAYNWGRDEGRELEPDEWEELGRPDPSEYAGEVFDAWNQSDSWAYMVLPELRSMAGCEDPMGIGTYTECDDDAEWLYDELVEKFIDGFCAGVVEILEQQ